MGLVALAACCGGLLMSLVVVPGLAVAVVDLHDAHAALEPGGGRSGRRRRTRRRRSAAHVRGSLLDVEGVGAPPTACGRPISSDWMRASSWLVAGPRSCRCTSFSR